MDSIRVICNNTPDTSIIWTIVVALCAIASVYVAIKMWKATKKYTEVTEDIFLSQQRPYIGRSRHIIRFIDGKKIIDLSLFIKNYGTIPAKNVSAVINVFVNGTLLSDVENNKTEGQVLFPTQEHPIDFVFDLHKIPDSYDEIKNGKLTFEIITEIRYDGVTKTQYTTKEKEVYKHIINSFLKVFGEWN